MTIEKCEKTYKQHIHIHPEIAIEFTHARSRFKGSSDYFPLHRHHFKRSYLSVAYLIYKQTSPKGRHAAVSQDSGELCAKMVM